MNIPYSSPLRNVGALVDVKISKDIIATNDVVKLGMGSNTHINAAITKIANILCCVTVMSLMGIKFTGTRRMVSGMSIDTINDIGIFGFVIVVFIFVIIVYFFVLVSDVWFLRIPGDRYGIMELWVRKLE